MDALSLTFFAKRRGALRPHEERLRPGRLGMFTGTVGEYRGELQLTHPDYQLVGVDVDADPGHPERQLVFVGQSGLGLPDEEYYRLPDHEDLRALYLAHIRKSFDLAGVADADGQATMAFDELEVAFVKSAIFIICDLASELFKLRRRLLSTREKHSGRLVEGSTLECLAELAE